MNATYDHLVAVVLVGIIFIGTVVAMPAAMSSNTFEAVDQQQLRNITLNAFNAMLLGPGDPSNWGSKYPFNPSEVRAFGLSSSAPFSTFVLDSDKVQRIDDGTVGYIDYARTLELLNLQGYGFQFSLYRPFKVDTDIDWSDTTIENVQLSVNVTRTEDNTPIPNAIVKAKFIGIAVKFNDADELKVVVSDKSYNATTDVLGRATLSGVVTVPADFTLDQAVASIHITVAGMDTMVMASKKPKAAEVLKVSTFGDNVTLVFNRDGFYGNYSNTGSRKVEYIYGYDIDSLMSLYNSSGGNEGLLNGGSYETWSKIFPGLNNIDPSMLIFIVSVPIPPDFPGYKPGRTDLLMAGPFGFSSSDKVFQFGPENPPGRVLSTMRRLVLISGMTYVAEMILWKEQI